MTRKPRRSKPAEKAAQPEATTSAPETPAEGTPAAKKPAARKAAAKKPAAKKPAAKKSAAESSDKMTLPAFGFAADLLPKSDATKSPEPSARGAAAAGRDDPAAGAPAAGAPAAGAPVVDEKDPRRIFAFADSLEAESGEPEAAPVRLETWVAFSLAGEVFALPVAPIREVVRVSSITRVPHAPKPIRGVTNRRGRVIPVIDLRMRIELPAAELGRASRVIVVSSRGRLLGLLVDAVHQVVHIDLEKVQPPPDDVMTVQSDYLSGVYHLEDQLILLLDVDRALIIQGPAEPAGTEATSDPRPGAPAEIA